MDNEMTQFERKYFMSTPIGHQEYLDQGMKIAAGDFHSLILLETGQVLATGSNSSGQLGIGNDHNQMTSVPMNLGENEKGEKQKATAIVAGGYHSLILLESGQVLATGRNGSGQLGIGNREHQTTPVLMNLGENKEGKEQKATAIVAGEHHSLILLESGQVLVTGSNDSGQLGIGNDDNQMTPVLMNLGKNEKGKEQKATAVSAGDYYSLILLENGQVLATGRNDYGQLGIGNRDEQTTPVLMNLGENKDGKEQKAIAMSAGGYHSLILLESGQVLATGRNDSGQLGIGSRNDQTTPVLMNLGENKEGKEQKATAIATGGYHSLILLESRQVLATGGNGKGQLGIGSRDDQTTPVLMNLGKNEKEKEQKATAIAAGGFHSLILLEGGQVLATGGNDYGQLGICNLGRQTTPVVMNLGGNENGEKQKAIAMAAGDFHSLILLDSGQVLAMGRNYGGQLGLGDRGDQMTPVPMNLEKMKEEEEQKAMAIAVNDGHSLILPESVQTRFRDDCACGSDYMALIHEVGCKEEWQISTPTNCPKTRCPKCGVNFNRIKIKCTCTTVYFCRTECKNKFLQDHVEDHKCQIKPSEHPLSERERGRNKRKFCNTLMT